MTWWLGIFTLSFSCGEASTLFLNGEFRLKVCFQFKVFHQRYNFNFIVHKLYVYLSCIVQQMVFWPLLGIATTASRARWAQVGWKIVKWNSHMLFSQNCSFVLTADTLFDVFVYTTKWNFLRYVVFLKKSNFFIYFVFNFQL